MYETGWNARQLLCHLADDNVTAFLLALAQRPELAAGVGEGFDLDVFNSQQVALRADKSVDELLEEIRRNIDRDVRAVRNASDELLQAHFRAPWGAEGSLGEVIVVSLTEHVEEHLADLSSARAGL